MINDNDQCIRKLGWRVILKVRSQKQSAAKVNDFVITELQYDNLISVFPNYVLWHNGVVQKFQPLTESK